MFFPFSLKSAANWLDFVPDFLINLPADSKYVHNKDFHHYLASTLEAYLAEAPAGFLSTIHSILTEATEHGKFVLLETLLFAENSWPILAQDARLQPALTELALSTDKLYSKGAASLSSKLEDLQLTKGIAAMTEDAPQEKKEEVLDDILGGALEELAIARQAIRGAPEHDEFSRVAEEETSLEPSSISEPEFEPADEEERAESIAELRSEMLPELKRLRSEIGGYEAEEELLEAEPPIPEPIPPPPVARPAPTPAPKTASPRPPAGPPAAPAPQPTAAPAPASSPPPVAGPVAVADDSAGETPPYEKDIEGLMDKMQKGMRKKARRRAPKAEAAEPPAPSPALRSEVVRRDTIHTHVHYYSRMNSHKTYPFTVTLSGIAVKIAADKTHLLSGEKEKETRGEFELREVTKRIVVEPLLSGCLVQPTSIFVDPRPQNLPKKLTFFVTPLVETGFRATSLTGSIYVRNEKGATLLKLDLPELCVASHRVSQIAALAGMVGGGSMPALDFLFNLNLQRTLANQLDYVLPQATLSVNDLLTVVMAAQVIFIILTLGTALLWWWRKGRAKVAPERAKNLQIPQ